MKYLSPLILTAALAVTPQSHAEGWLDSVKDFFGILTQCRLFQLP